MDKIFIHLYICENIQRIKYRNLIFLNTHVYILIKTFIINKIVAIIIL